ncbi:MAG: hypothetical protein JSW65_00915 [Candidatus Bipolaricaulota bacterium]|nr:MAG: hypothetical protein JSW65_00915 [Candidatus Bipolaricaulota bacterium]
MDLRLMTPRQSLREYSERLERAAIARRRVEIHQRMRVRNRLRKAILEIVKLDGKTPEVAVELNGLIRSVERRLSGRPCC